MTTHLEGLAVSTACTVAAFPLYPTLNVTNIAMLYLLGTTVVAVRVGRGPAILCCLTAVLELDFFYVPPIFSLQIDDMPYVFTLAVMLIVALVITSLVDKIKRHAAREETAHRRTAILYALSQDLGAGAGVEATAATAAQHASRILGGAAYVLLATPDGTLDTAAGVSGGEDSRIRPTADILRLAQKSFARGEKQLADAICLPLRAGQPLIGVLVLWPTDPIGEVALEQWSFFDAVAGQIAAAVQKCRSDEEAGRAGLAAERATMRNTLLASISHDLRTPLAAIAGAGGLLSQPEYVMSDDRRATLGLLIERKAQDMGRLLSNVLELSRIESGDLELRTDWYDVEEMIAHALRTNAGRLAHHRIVTEIPAHLPQVLVEATLLIQIVNNLLENAAKYTPPGTRITVSAAIDAELLTISVVDDGPGLGSGDPDRLFEKFYRGRAEGSAPGAGLGLAICRAAARLHGGDINAHNSPSGASFVVRLPVDTERDVTFCDTAEAAGRAQ